MLESDESLPKEPKKKARSLKRQWWREAVNKDRIYLATKYGAARGFALLYLVPGVESMAPKTFDILARVLYMRFFESLPDEKLNADDMWPRIRTNAMGKGWITRHEFDGMAWEIFGALADIQRHPTGPDRIREASSWYRKGRRRRKELLLELWRQRHREGKLVYAG